MYICFAYIFFLYFKKEQVFVYLLLSFMWQRARVLKNLHIGPVLLFFVSERVYTKAILRINI